MMRHLTDEQLLLDFYGESTAAERTRVRTHLEQCDECRTVNSELRAVLTAVDTTPLTEPPSGFEREMWARVEPLLPVREPWHTRWSGMIPRLAVAASIGVLLVAAFAAGRIWDRSPVRSSAAIADDQAMTERLLRGEVEDHLERSQRMLVELVNADYEVGAPIAGDRARAADLVAAGRLYRRSAEQIGDAEIGGLLEDLERVLVEVANGSADVAPEDMGRLRQRIDDQDLLFRVRVVAREIRERGW
jgi:Putative zinc-finger